ncbi:MAG: aminotransferase class IV [Chloroflexota bacterium]
MDEIVYLNGVMLPRSQASISVMDYGFLYGYALFETMRAYGGRVFGLDRHLARLARSAELLSIKIGGLDLKSAVMDTLRANRLSEARIRITVSIGEGGMAPDPASCKSPTVLVVAGAYQPYPEPVYEKGLGAIVSSVRRNQRSLLSALKSANYLESILAREQARAAGAGEAICLNEAGLLAEASMSNAFLVTRGTLRTPGTQSGILPGITREIVLELAGRMGIKAVEQDIRLEELLQAEEAFLTSSLIEVMPLSELDGKMIGSGRPGTITRKLRQAYRELVASGTELT